MELSVKGKQMDVGDALRTHVEEQLQDVVGKFFGDSSLTAQVTFSREAHLFRADITVHASRGILLQSNAAMEEPYPAFDAALARIGARLRRYKTKLKDHRADEKAEDALVANSFVLSSGQDTDEEIPDNPAVVAEMTTPIETLTVSEAVMRLDLGDLPALMFRSRSHGGMNMIYRRADGHIGWVDPAQNPAAPEAPTK